MCTHKLGNLPCDNKEPHKGNGKGCTHTHLNDKPEGKK